MPLLTLSVHPFFMSKAKYGKRVIKSVVRHRTCGTCNWWRRNRPSMPVRKHRCVQNRWNAEVEFKELKKNYDMKGLQYKFWNAMEILLC